MTTAEKRESTTTHLEPALEPLDEHNRTLRENVQPPDWVNPEPSGRYNMVVIGAGTAGLVTAAGAAGLGAKVALVERSLLGGDCLNVGCVPSKALIRCARAAAEVRDAGEFGVDIPGGAQVDFSAIMERMRRQRARISPHDSAARFRDLGIDVFLGKAAFTGPDSVAVAGETLRFARACIATGGRPVAPPVDGLRGAGYLTNETIFSLTELPTRLAVIGGGPIGCEMAQTFARFGSRVTLIEASERLLPRDDPDAADIIAKTLQRDGVDVRLGVRAERVEERDGAKVVILSGEGGGEFDADEILVSAGRAPNVMELALERAGVRYDEKAGVEVDDRLRTSNRRIYAAGDVASKYKFTHVADALARIVIGNALFFGRSKASGLTVPWCTYTDPEVAHVGLQPDEARGRGEEVATMTLQLGDVDRAILDGEEEGVLKVHYRKGGDRVLGATLVARHAGEMISELVLAITTKQGLGALSKTIHPYPTQAEIFRKAGDRFNRQRLTPRMKKVFEKFLQWRR